jgi:hypothetical protein
MAPRHAPLPAFPQQPLPYISDASRRDPRAFGRAFDPSRSGDEIAQQNVRRQIARGVTPLEDVIDDLDARNLPPQLWQTPFPGFIKAYGVAGAILLIPANPARRFGFTLSNFTGANLVMFSYGAPIDMGGGVGLGIPVSPCFGETNGSISVNDIYMFCNDSTETYPIAVGGWEGGISISGNRR